jgi:hypothetical protein
MFSLKLSPVYEAALLSSSLHSSLPPAPLGSQVHKLFSKETEPTQIEVTNTSVHVCLRKVQEIAAVKVEVKVGEIGKS